MLQCFLGDAAVAATDDQYIPRLAVREDGHVRHHLVIDEFVTRGDLRCAIEHQHLAEMLMLEQHQVLVIGVLLVQHLLDRITHAETEIVEQRFGQPAFLDHDSSAPSWPGLSRPSMSLSQREVQVVNARDKPRHVGDYVPCPRRCSPTAMRAGWNASRSTGTQASGLARPHMKISIAA